MKISRLIGVALTVMLVIALALSITACKDDNKDDPAPTDKVITGVEFNDDTFTYDGTEKRLEVTGTLPEGVSVSYTDNVGTDAGVYNATATLSGAGYETLTLEAKLTISKASITGIIFDSLTVTYDGSEHSITATGDIPEGAEVSYSSNSATDAGTYTATLTVTHKNYDTYNATAALIINKATIQGITLTSATFTYEDGVSRALEYVGELPDGVEAEWVGNGATEVGNHPVTLTLSGKNYQTLELNAFIIIESPVVSDKVIEGVTLSDGVFTYDGTEKSLTVSGDIPEGVTVSYVGNGKINAGTSTVTAVLSGEGYKTLTVTATLTINKAKITGITLEDGVFTYAQNVIHNLRISGTLPEGTTVEYEGNSQYKVGTYEVTATITGENYETLVLKATLTVKFNGGGGITTPEMPF